MCGGFSPNRCSQDLAEAGPTCGVIRAADYDQSCATSADCTSVFEGDTCSAGVTTGTVYCACPNATINQKALAGYHPVFVGGSVVCPCPMIGTPSCIGGVCRICPGDGCPL
jgi:hypothetical protein